MAMNDLIRTVNMAGYHPIVWLLLRWPTLNFPRMQNTIAFSITALGLVFALIGAWITWGAWSTLVVGVGALLAFGLVSID